MTIEQIRAQLKDVNRELIEARSAAVALAADANADRAQRTAATERLNDLKARRDILKESLDAETEAQSANLKAIRGETDQIQQTAKAFKSAGDFFSCVARASGVNPVIDPRLAEYASVRSDASGQNITTDAEGGYLIPPDYSDELLKHVQSESVLLPEVDHTPVSGNRLIENEVDEESRKDWRDADQAQSITAIKGRNGGILAYWKGEAAEYTASQMRFKQRTTSLGKLTGLCYATDEMLEDLPAMASIIDQGFADEFAFKCDDAILNGTGTNMPIGILATGNASLVTIAKESGQAAASIELNNILKMFNAMPAAQRANAKWYINQDLEIVLYMLLMQAGGLSYSGTDGNSDPVALSASSGVPIFVPAGGLASAPNGLLLGRPIVPIEQCSALGDKGDIIFANMGEYRWIDKGGINGQTSIHVRFLYDEMAFKFTYRAGGRPKWSNTIEAYKGSTLRSPFVTLAARS